MFEIPFLALAVDPKILAFFGEFGLSHPEIQNVLKLEECSAETLGATVFQLWENRHHLVQLLKTSAHRLKSQKEIPKVIERASEPHLTKNWRTWVAPLHDFRQFFISTRFLFVFSVLMSFILATLIQLRRDGLEIFNGQKSAIVLDVFAKTDLTPDFYPLIEEGLRDLSGVHEVISISPDESLRQLTQGSQLESEAQWLNQKNEELRGKGAVLPWTYKIHPVDWNDASIAALVSRVENLEVGVPKTKAISETYYDRERLSLTVALENYVRWITAVLLTVFVLAAVLIFAQFLRWLRLERHKAVSLLKENFLPTLLVGLLAGLSSHLLFLLVLSFSFFSESFSWLNHLGHLLAPQIALAVVSMAMIHGFYLLRKHK
jgi:cell division protein FtsX